MKLARIILVFQLALTACASDTNERNTDAAALNDDSLASTINFSVVKSLPHDTTLFTEGLLIHDGQLYESTGSPEEMSHTRSLVGIIDTMTGRLHNMIELDKNKYFGEGIVFFKDKLYQLTYKNKICRVYDAKTFRPINQFIFHNEEGWGLTSNDTCIIMSDGTSRLTFVTPETFTPVKTLDVTQDNMPLDKLNELEYINGYLYANVWLTNYIVKIDPSNGKVIGRLDLSSLLTLARNNYSKAGELNGIAYDRATDKIYITGKLWPNLYQVNFPH